MDQADYDTPVVVVDMDRVERNIALMAMSMSDRGVALRPHVKTHKNIHLARLQLANGARGISVATLGEAELFAANGFDDIFIAYPLYASAPKARRLRDLYADLRSRGTGAGLSVGCDSLTGAAALADAMAGSGHRLPVMIEVDCGGHRSGVDRHRVLEQARGVTALGLELRGIFTHAGQSYGGVDAKRRAADDEVDHLSAAAESLARAGFDDLVVSAGSTPTAVLSARGAVTEERPGTYVFGDRTQAALGADGWSAIALTVATTVVSVSADEPRRIVLDAGSKILSSDLAALAPGFGVIPELGDATITRLYEHHGVCEVQPDVALPAVGDVVRVVPNHACPVVNLVDSLRVERSGRPTGETLQVDARGF